MTHITKYLLVSIATLSLIACATPVQLMYDAEVDRLCALDGGAKVYEIVQLPPEHFNTYGQLTTLKPSKGEYALGPEYRYESVLEYLREGPGRLGEAALIKHSLKIYRRSDGKLLGSSIVYGRGGGDIPGPWHPSSYTCPKNLQSLETQIFIPKRQ